MTTTPLRRALALALVLAAAALVLYAYRELPGRPFAADDYQWLLNVRGLSWDAVTERALDVGAQTHFFRPLVWLLFWAQTESFGLAPAPFHAVSLTLHLLNAGLLAWLVYRVLGSRKAPYAAAAFAIAALHPAPFEAVVWLSAQSELLAAALLLAAVHLWLPPARAASDEPAEGHAAPYARALLATFALGLALLAKESAVIGLGLLLLSGAPSGAGRHWAKRLVPFALPVIVTAAYLALQQQILARNEIIRGAGYGLGPQLLLNPLRTLGLVVAPLSGTQYGDAWWLPWAGAAAVGAWALDFGRLAVRDRGLAATSLQLGLAVLLTLLPTAPFTSPPDSRYVYLPVLAVATLIAVRLAAARMTDHGPRTEHDRVPALHGPRPTVLGIASLLALALLAWWSAGELASREGRFAAASGPGGSLWRLASSECAATRPSRIVVVEPPLAPPHAEAIVRLACGPDVRPVVVGRDGVADVLRPNALVVAFPGGGAQVEQRT